MMSLIFWAALTVAAGILFWLAGRRMEDAGREYEESALLLEQFLAVVVEDRKKITEFNDRHDHSGLAEYLNGEGKIVRTPTTGA